MPTDPLAPLLDLAGVADALTAARDRVDQALRHPALRRLGGAVAAEVSLRSAVASAALDGSRYEVDDVRAGTVPDPVVQGALRVAGALGGLVEIWPRAPRQALARLHVLAARGSVDDAELGRPRPEAIAASQLDRIVGLVTDGRAAPGLLRAAILHADLLALRPFAGPSGVVVRAAARLELMASGLDPRGLVAVEAGHLRRESEYVGSAGAFATGTPDGLRSWLRHYAAAVELGAAELEEIGAETAGTRGRRLNS